ncbi:hypothetical protein [Mucilaginibacter flavidus]|uniref:hypothetical protein n=1 Tax=Mucilaginibacter flavidus TaxID=2949309 RepID=UPI00209357E2|nr:hypothetical protein [Mucilaginibacter flavidus]MCO5951204.1 hypothetical protein [Mucilaginibacter flavidus]
MTHNECRGYFIAKFSELEQVIDRYLARYFTIDSPVVEQEIIEVLIDRIPFESKRTALKFLLDKKCEEDFLSKKYGNHKRNYKALLENIRKLAHTRNYFAHYQTMPFLQPDSRIGFIQYRDSAKVISFSEKEFDDLMKLIGRCNKDVREVLNQLEARAI